MDVKKFIGFLSKYAGETVGIAGVFRSILPALPIGRADRENVEAVLEKLEGIPASVEAAIRDLTKAPPVVIKKSDLEAAVKAVLPGVVKPLIDKAVADALAAAAKKA